ncbi:MAG TPA: hypothetical protein VFC85_01010 [Verrucomicrobiae bacterium]|nr:hypothetical protein [Verrucomicrobiae bacterium]
MMKIRLHGLLVIVMSLLAGQLCVHGQGTAFTYQGRLDNNGAPVNGNYDFTFAVFNSSGGGSPAVGPITNSAVTVSSNGLFTTILDFGSVPTGNPLWLEISVRTNGGGSFMTLNPRQQLLPVPYAMFANTAGNFSGNLLGTTNDEALEFEVNGSPALRLEPTTSAPNIIGGSSGNSISPGAFGATISGGGSSTSPNTILNSAEGATIGGGLGNTVGDNYGAIAAGQLNTVLANSSFIGGGYLNTIQSGAADSTIFGGLNNAIQSGSFYSTIGSGLGNIIATNSLGATIVGGQGNMNSANYGTIVAGSFNSIQSAAQNSFIGGGAYNTNLGAFAIIPGGSGNVAAANAFAAGSGALATNRGAFVWADSSSSQTFNSTQTNQFLIRATGGVGINTNNPAGAALNVNGAIIAKSFSGDGSGLTGIVASSTNTLAGGTMSAAFNFTNTANNFVGTFFGNGAGLTNLNANATNFPGGTMSAAFNFTNNANTFFGAFSGNGAALTGLNPANLGSGTAASAINFNNSGNTFVGTFSGNGSGLTGVSATLPPGNVSAALNFTNAANTFTGAFTGNGAGLTGINPASLTSGTASSAINFTNKANNFSGTFSGNGAGLTGINPASLTSGTASSAINFTNKANNFSGTFSGDGSNLTNLPGGSGGSTGANYLFCYDTTLQSINTPNTFQDITFDTTAQLNGWTHTTGTAAFTSQQSGLYLVQYSAEGESTSSATSTISVIATLNGTEISGSQSSVDTHAAGQNIPTAKSFIVNVTAGNILTLQVTGTTTNDRLLSNNGSGSTRPSVSLTIIRIQ